MLSIISNILSLVGLVLGEIFAAKKRARLKQEAFELDQKMFNEMVQRTLVKMRQNVQDTNAQLNDLDDQMR